ALKLADDGKSGVLVEVNSETDFVARDENFLAFVGKVVDAVAGQQQTDVAVLMSGELESQREALVQKIGENISVRRAEFVEGPLVGGYVHGNGKIAVLVALTGGDAELAKDVAMHIAAVNPQVAKPEDMSAALLEKERSIYSAQAADSGKPAEIVEKMVEGRLRKFIAESSLVEQPFVKDPDLKVGQLLKNAGADIAGFVRFEVGEGIAKEEVDFAAEVAAQVQQSS
ncbi:MAG: elongation factor Ts, partial [Gammaproteobacteria bacterium]|nr:elongation factor Ts [Gammaproteobacteria bacterium]